MKKSNNKYSLRHLQAQSEHTIMPCPVPPWPPWFIVVGEAVVFDILLFIPP